MPESIALEPEDYYFDGPLLVFTAAYHLKRGYCCGSGCRHCPYGSSRTTSPDRGESSDLLPAGSNARNHDDL